MILAREEIIYQKFRNVEKGNKKTPPFLAGLIYPMVIWTIQELFTIVNV